MQRDATLSAAGQTQSGSVVALWRDPVKSMMGEELNSSEVTDRGLLGDRQFAVVNRATGKVGGAKNPRKWGNFFDFRASYAEAPKLGGRGHGNDHTAAGRPTQRLRNPPYGCSTQRSQRRRLRLGGQLRHHPP